mmetsp:Transcript_42453/g.70601  ORF Transcript_42453/g.70601 Transcript_42453/m.70601 type:complete len:397 (+) Transcript_42453:166-1356(+)
MLLLVLFVPSSIDLLTGAPASIGLDGVMGGDSTGSLSSCSSSESSVAWDVTLDGVMGGDSTGAVTGGDSIGKMTGVGTCPGVVFDGVINTVGGGFATMSLSHSPPLKLLGAKGVLITVETAQPQMNGFAPTAFELEFGVGEQANVGCCSLTAAFAVPVTAVPMQVSLYVPFNALTNKGPFWVYFWGAKGFCPPSLFPFKPLGCKTTLDQVRLITVGNYYQAGAYKLKLLAMKTVEDGLSAGDALLQSAAPSSAHPMDLLSAAAERASALMDKGTAGSNAGVGADPMNHMASAILEVALRQSANSTACSPECMASVLAAADTTSAKRAAGNSMKLQNEVLLSEIKQLLEKMKTPPMPLAPPPPPFPPVQSFTLWQLFKSFLFFWPCNLGFVPSITCE